MAMPRYELTRCPVCDDAQAVELADQEAIRREVETLWAFHERRLRPSIPPERLTDRLAFSQHPPIRVAACAGCGHVYRNPWERETSLEAAYAEAGAPASALEGMFQAQRSTCRRQLQRLTRLLERSGSLLEVGPYTGGFLAHAVEQGWTVRGVDVNPDAVAFARGKGLSVYEGTIADLDPTLRFDAIAIWNTFEQQYDARASLHEAHVRLNPGGLLALRVPNGSFYRRWRTVAAGDQPRRPLAIRLLALNNFLGFPYRQAFTRGSLTRLLTTHGFDPIALAGDTLSLLADEWTRKWAAREERRIKRIQRRVHRGWRAPWVEIYARAA